MKPVLYVKNGCPWCVEAETHLKQEGVDYDRKEVRSDPVAMEEMIKLFGPDPYADNELGRRSSCGFWR